MFFFCWFRGKIGLVVGVGIVCFCCLGFLGEFGREDLEFDSFFYWVLGLRLGVWLKVIVLFFCCIGLGDLKEEVKGLWCFYKWNEEK